MSDIPKHTITFQRMLGENLVNFITYRVRKAHMNVRLEKFASYEKSYATLKAKGKAGPKGVSIASKSVIPDMTLTGATMDGLVIFGGETTKKSFTWGWIGADAKIVRDLFGHKNYQIINLGAGEVLSRLENDLIHRAYDKDYDKKIDKYHRETINLKLEL